MRRLLMAPVLILALLLGGCASHQGVVLKDGKANLQLSGQCEGVSLQIDDNDSIAVAGDCEDSIFSVTPGRHVVKLYRNGKMILERLIYFSSGETSEVTLP
jgi:uncharacterized protein YcfL